VNRSTKLLYRLFDLIKADVLPFERDFYSLGLLIYLINAQICTINPLYITQYLSLHYHVGLMWF